MLERIREKEAPRPSARLSISKVDAISGISAQRQIDPSKLKNLLRGELDWGVLKSLEKDRTRRYDSANSLAGDIQNYLSGDIVTARPPSGSYRMRKYVRRNKSLVAVITTIASLVLVAMIGIGWFALAAEKARKMADQKTIRVYAEKLRPDQKTEEVFAEKQRAETALTTNEANLARSNCFLAVAR